DRVPDRIRLQALGPDPDAPRHDWPAVVQQDGRLPGGHLPRQVVLPGEPGPAAVLALSLVAQVDPQLLAGSVDDLADPHLVRGDAFLVARIEADRLHIIFGGAGGVAILLPRQAPAVVPFGHAGRQPQRLVVTADRLVELPLAGVGKGAVRVELSVARLELDRPAEVLEGQVDLAPVQAHAAAD